MKFLIALLAVIALTVPSIAQDRRDGHHDRDFRRPPPPTYYGGGVWGGQRPVYRGPVPYGAGRFWRGQWYPQVAGSACWVFLPVLGWTWTCADY